MYYCCILDIVVLSKEMERKILIFVQEQPRTIQEIALLLDKNWRTADSYVHKIMQETGLLGVKTFREGTRGALKIVFWNALGQSQSSYQERLSKKILFEYRKEGFSAFDIFQFVEQGQAHVMKKSFSLHANKQMFIFSGNGSWITQKEIKQIEELAKSGVSCKILLRVDVTSQEIVKQLLLINERVGEDLIMIRHCEHPLRGVICDNRVELKETLSPTDSRYRELKKPVTILYTFSGMWCSWLEKVFWKLWETSIDAKTRLQAIEKISFS